MYYNTKQTPKLKPGLVTFYDIRPGNGAGLFSKEKIRRQVRNSGEKKIAPKWGSI